MVKTFLNVESVVCVRRSFWPVAVVFTSEVSLAYSNDVG